jgi:integrase/recombinase XerD
MGVNIKSERTHRKKSIATPLRRQKLSKPLPDVFKDYLRYKRKYCQTPERTISANHRVLGAFANYLRQHRIKLQKLRIEQIDDFLADYLNGYSTATGRAYRGYLRGFLSYLFDERRLLSKDLAPLVTGPPLFSQSKPPTFLRKGQLGTGMI